ncbi:MAG: TIGR04325 family methyltransferase [Xanthomonadaceae bacterium]|nr:TIGR04325 family methyltransferase [Xanthomonadaceae bacterium]MDP2185176.1 TIGR04325 family methyltransferase [Xanthomonadales bacterium]MDZ4116961.1 TIGR04325 family methyltransferase [Xanthomonadaceae bacterium]MDZ4377969.1 TIGR04325 family methyltransferase [Xanthomonadaceae bacterium]
MLTEKLRLTGRICRRIANEIAQLPGIELLAQPLYRRLFARQFFGGNSYCGAWATFAEAKANAPVLLPSSYDSEPAGKMYRNELERITVSDYPVLYWLTQLLATGQHRVFDLGGHIGIKYYAFRRYLHYPPALRWVVHDVPAVLAQGRQFAAEHDPERRLDFAASPDDASGCDVVLSTGALQYLDYTLAELIARLPQRPQHVLVNLTPMHPSRSYFTLQHIGIAICPYRVSAVPEFVTAMEKLGYTTVDRWATHERNVRIPFRPECDIDSYHGFYFRRES